MEQGLALANFFTFAYCGYVLALDMRSHNHFCLGFFADIRLAPNMGTPTVWMAGCAIRCFGIFGFHDERRV